MNAFVPNFNNNVELQNNLKNKIIWINSFQIKDADFISKFINEYFAKQKGKYTFSNRLPNFIRKNQSVFKCQ